VQLTEFSEKPQLAQDAEDQKFTRIGSTDLGNRRSIHLSYGGTPTESMPDLEYILPANLASASRIQSEG
jgi:hypothetical protein